MSMSETKSTAEGYVAVILVRGLVRVRQEIKDALATLNLTKKHACIILPDNKVTRGQLQKCKDYITYGTITPATKQLLEQHGAKNGVFHLPPPRGGFGRKGVKKSYREGGALGDRGEAINDLLKRMVG